MGPGAMNESTQQSAKKFRRISQLLAFVGCTCDRLALCSSVTTSRSLPVFVGLPNLHSAAWCSGLPCSCSWRRLRPAEWWRLTLISLVPKSRVQSHGGASCTGGGEKERKGRSARVARRHVYCFCLNWVAFHFWVFHHCMTAG